jgi:Ribonuclease G/E
MRAMSIKKILAYYKEINCELCHQCHKAGHWKRGDRVCRNSDFFVHILRHSCGHKIIIPEVV